VGGYAFLAAQGMLTTARRPSANPYSRAHGADNPAAVVPVRIGERVIVGLLLKLPKLQAEKTSAPLGKLVAVARGRTAKSEGRDGNG
jgi:hypothetical protein